MIEAMVLTKYRLRNYRGVNRFWHHSSSWPQPCLLPVRYQSGPVVIIDAAQVGLGALGLNTNVFYFVFYVFDFLATVPTPLVASARAEGDFARAAK